MHILFLGQDLPLVISEFLQKKQALPRGLAHPLIFRSEEKKLKAGAVLEGAAASGGSASGGSSMKELFTTFGAVEISPMAYYQVPKYLAFKYTFLSYSLKRYVHLDCSFLVIFCF